MASSFHLACAGLLVAACSASSAHVLTDAGAEAHDAALADAIPFEASAPDATKADAGEAGDGSTASPDGGFVCPVSVDLASAACNACVTEYCDVPWCSCAQDTANLDEGGANGCQRYVTCVSDCVQTDAGLPTTCAQYVCAREPFSGEEQQEGQKLLDCVVLHCSSDCPQ